MTPFSFKSLSTSVQTVSYTHLDVYKRQVRYYNVHDESGEFLGGFYTDWFPRENKRGGAWMDALITGGPEGAKFRPHLGLVCGNLTPPVGGKPALLTHREVETIFHEFGHLLHHLPVSYTHLDVYKRQVSITTWYMPLPAHGRRTP